MLSTIARTRDISKEIEALTDATKDLERGAFVPHDKIMEVTGVNKQSQRTLYDKIIRRWKRLMLHKGHAVEAAVPLGTGYRLLSIDEQLKERPIRIQKQAMKKVAKAAAYIGSIPPEQLSEEDQRFQEARAGQLTALQATSDKQRAQTASWLSNPKTLPRASAKAIS